MIGNSLTQYRITASIGAGGMGEVFRARDTRLNRDVAVKVLPKDFVADADWLRRFAQEAKTLAALATVCWSPLFREDGTTRYASMLALSKPAAKRPAWLDAECEGDAALRQRLDALLAEHETSDELLAETSPAAKATMKLELTDRPDEAVGQTLGRYKLLERVGEGGCGVVYVAEQTDPGADGWRWP